MILYERSLRTQVVIMCLCIINMTIQLVFNQFVHTEIVILIISIAILIFLMIMVYLIIIDLVKKNYRVQRGKVVSIKKYRIHIQKSNGKIKKVDMRYNGIHQFSLNQPVELHSARITRYLVAIHSADEERFEIVT